MARDARPFRAEPLMLEAREMLAAPVPFSPPPSTSPTVTFQQAVIVASQQSDVATVTLVRNATPAYTGPLEVRVRTVPSQADGANLEPVDQTVTFAPSQDPTTARRPKPLKQAEAAFAADEEFATVAVPIIKGAPNPGEVDVELTLTPVDGPPDLLVGPPAVLQIKASADVAPPTITGSRLTSRGIELTFSAPMDPVQNLKNYQVWDSTRSAVSGNSTTARAMTGGILGMGSPFQKRTALPKRVPLRAAVYDPATQSVILIPTRPLSGSAITVMAWSLVDAQGNEIHRASAGGMVLVHVLRGGRPSH